MIGSLWSALTAEASTVTHLSGLSEFQAASIFSNDFETSLNTPQIMFEHTTERLSARIVTRGVTSSGQFVATERHRDAPMRFTFDVPGPVFEIGLFFGNDDFSYRFDDVLEVFGLDDTSLGSVRVAANRNDFADQFIGLRSAPRDLLGRLPLQPTRRAQSAHNDRRSDHRG